MVARGGGDGMDIGSERCLARDRKAVSAQKTRTTSQALAQQQWFTGRIRHVRAEKRPVRFAQAATRPNAPRRDAIFRRTKSI